MIIIVYDSKEMTKLQNQLATKIEMKNLGGLKYFLGMEVAKLKKASIISMKKYSRSFIKIWVTRL